MSTNGYLNRLREWLYEQQNQYRLSDSQIAFIISIVARPYWVEEIYNMCFRELTYPLFKDFEDNKKEFIQAMFRKMREIQYNAEWLLMHPGDKQVNGYAHRLVSEHETSNLAKSNFTEEGSRDLSKLPESAQRSIVCLDSYIRELVRQRDLAFKQQSEVRVGVWGEQVVPVATTMTNVTITPVVSDLEAAEPVGPIPVKLPSGDLVTITHAGYIYLNLRDMIVPETGISLRVKAVVVPSARWRYVSSWNLMWENEITFAAPGDYTVLTYRKRSYAFSTKGSGSAVHLLRGAWSSVPLFEVVDVPLADQEILEPSIYCPW